MSQAEKEKVLVKIVVDRSSKANPLTFALESLPDDAVQHRTTVITKGWSFVVVHGEAMRHVDAEAVAAAARLVRKIRKRVETNKSKHQ